MEKSEIIERGNNFHLLRLVAACAVIYSHAFALEGHPDPLRTLSDYNMGGVAVSSFFCISGYVIAGSIDRRSLASFCLSRILRIFPGLLACTAVTAIVASLVSTLGFVEYFTHHQTLRYIFGTGTLLSTEYSLPGVFSENFSTVANGSLWTLRYEIACYAGIAAIFSLFPTITRRFSVLAGSLAVCIGIVLASKAVPLPAQFRTIAFLAIPFLIGAIVYVKPSWKISVSIVAVSLIIAYASAGSQISDVAFSFAVALTTLYLAFLSLGRFDLSRWIPDYSYGIYIYGCPVQQLLIQFFPDVTTTGKFVMAMAAVLAPATLSWHFVEKPGLKMKSWFDAGDLTRAALTARIRKFYPS